MRNSQKRYCRTYCKEQLDKISEKTHQLVDLQYSTYNRSLVPALKQNGLRIVMEHEDLTEDEAAFCR